MSDYRKRFFEGYISTHVGYAEKISPQSFEVVAKIFKKHISRFLPESKTAKILDIACGSGHLLHFLQSQGYSRTQGIDLGAEQLEIARKMGVKNIEAGDLFTFLKEYQDHFDLIIAFQIIEHLSKNEAVDCMDLIYRALKEGGKVLVATPNVTSPAGLWSTFGDFTHELVFTSRSLSQLLRVSGFSNVGIYGQGPVAYNFRSGIRLIMWKVLKKILSFCFLVQRGMGGSIWKDEPIYEAILLGEGQKQDESIS